MCNQVAKVLRNAKRATTRKVKKVVIVEGRKGIETWKGYMGVLGVLVMFDFCNWFIVTQVTLIKHVFRFHHFSTYVLYFIIL